MSEPDTEIKRYRDQDVVLPLLVVSGTGPNLLGRNWLSHLEVNLSNLNLIKIDPQLQETLDKYPVVFSDGLGCAYGPPVKLIVPDTASPGADPGGGNTGPIPPPPPPLIQCTQHLPSSQLWI